MTIAKADKHLRAGRHGEALKAFRKILDADPENAAAYCGLAALSLALGKPDSAAGMVLKALSIDPDCGDGHKIFTRVVGELETPEEVAQLYFGHSQDLKAKGRLDAALTIYRKALRFDPTLALTDDHDSAHMLAAGDLQAGWMAYEWRDTIAAPGPFTDRFWNAEDLTGKTILVWGEQGIGDHMMFANCLPDLIARVGSSGRVIVETDRRLVSLFARSFPDAVIHGSSYFKGTTPVGTQNLDWLKDYPEPDYFVFLGSLPRFLRPTLESFPKAGTRFMADPEHLTLWRQRLRDCGPGMKIGICWRSLRMTEETSLYFPPLACWRALFALSGVRFINLQAGSTDPETAEIGADLITFDDLDLVDDLDGAASLIGALDAVITAGTNIQWLAPALGIPTWTVAKNRKDLDWGLLGQDHYPWVPDLKVHFAEEDDDLTRIFETVAGEVTMLPKPAELL